MSKPSNLESYVERWQSELATSRNVILCVGCACMLLGLAAVLVPWRLFGSFAWLLGLILLLSGLIKSAQLLPRRERISRESKRRSWFFILAEVALDLALGCLLIYQRSLSANLIGMLFGLAFIAESVVLLAVGLYSPTLRARTILGATAALTGAVGLAIVLRIVPEPLRWAGFLVGAKLLLFGASLVAVAIKAPRAHGPVLYTREQLVPEVAELYAVYFGTAFHLGVYIGEGEVVHYLDDNLVHRVTWEKFLDGRDPQHWTYPDLPDVEDMRVVETAISEVGKTYPYNLLKFNCEHFAIFCKSGGATKHSAFAQVPASVASVQTHPLVGMVAELNTRVFEWLAFHLGGAFGKQLSLQIRKLGSTITAVLVRPMKPEAPAH